MYLICLVLSIYLSMYVSIFYVVLSVRLSIYLSVCLSVCLIYLFLFVASVLWGTSCYSVPPKEPHFWIVLPSIRDVTRNAVCFKTSSLEPSVWDGSAPVQVAQHNGGSTPVGWIVQNCDSSWPWETTVPGFRTDAVSLLTRGDPSTARVGHTHTNWGYSTDESNSS